MKCGKRCYDKIGAMLKLATRRKNGGDEQRIYWCYICKSYHLTSQKKKRKNEM